MARQSQEKHISKRIPHAFERMFERAVPLGTVVRVVAEGEGIASYPDDLPFPSVLILGFDGARPLH